MTTPPEDGVTDEMVEAGALAIAKMRRDRMAAGRDQPSAGWTGTWDEISKAGQDIEKQLHDSDARAALEAVLPLLSRRERARGMMEILAMADDNEFDTWKEWVAAGKALARAALNGSPETEG